MLPYPNSFQISSPALINGLNGMWLTEDNTTGVGFKAPLPATNTYQIVLPSALPPQPNNYFLGVNSISGSDLLYSQWLQAAGKIPWSVAVPGSAYESISEYTSIATALSDAQATNTHISVLILPGSHNAQPNVTLPKDVDLIGWGTNVSIINGGVVINGPYTPTRAFWYIKQLSIINNGKGNVALQMTNSGVPINNGGVVFVDNSFLSGGDAIRNDDGGLMGFQVCQFDANDFCFVGANGGSITLFDSVVLPSLGGSICDMDDQRFLLNWSGVFKIPGRSQLSVRNSELRIVSSFLNLEDINVVDGDLLISDSFVTDDCNVLLQTSTVGGTAKIYNSRLPKLIPDTLMTTTIINSFANLIQTNNASGFDLTLQNSTFDTIDIEANLSLNINRLKMTGSVVNELLLIRGKCDPTSFVIGSQLFTNVAIQAEPSTSSSIKFIQNYLNLLNVNSPNASVLLNFFGNHFEGISPVVNLDMNLSDNPLFINNLFDLSGNLIISQTTGVTVLSQNNIATTGAIWNTPTVVPGWVEL